MTILDAIKQIKDDVINQSEYITDDHGIIHKVIDPIMVIDIINERLQGCDETVTDFVDRCRECGKVKKGKWEVLDWQDEIYTNVAVCSICDAEVINNGKDKFCPNCGASMEVDE